MTPRVLLDTAEIPNGGGELRLFQRGHEFSIMLGSNELMNSRLSGSEEALATLPCERLSDRTAARILIGGMGMGFTLRAALPLLDAKAEIIVAELVPAVVQWARGPMAETFDGSLDDPRVTIETVDVFDLISQNENHYDAILLDVDNGPDGITHASNDRLYTTAGLKTAKGALRSEGILAVWSSAPDTKFTRRLRDVGFAVEEAPVRARGKRGAHHMIWLAQN
ncbi:MnmC family methyltransferase [Sphingorhabdus sp. EL138]|uniref:spermine/spermidine synthase domain-containing protein n=1 Tax=Sphingorhabdus sp. EL138 TaxID=2073156 RepID=UPI000D696294|nr:MnmC family methyltransferase [Sphingorhabdus sp. EL138]